MSDPFAGAGKAIDPDVPPAPIPDPVPDPVEEFAERVAERWMNSGGRYDDFIAIISSELRAGGWQTEKMRFHNRYVPIEKPVSNEAVTQAKRANPSADIGYSS